MHALQAASRTSAVLICTCLALACLHCAQVERLDECADFESQMAELQALIDSGAPVTTDALAAQNKKLIEENQRLRRSLSAYK
jgi:hypothetical protein